MGLCKDVSTIHVAIWLDLIMVKKSCNIHNKMGFRFFLAAVQFQCLPWSPFSLDTPLVKRCLKPLSSSPPPTSPFPDIHPPKKNNNNTLLTGRLHCRRHDPIQPLPRRRTFKGARHSVARWTCGISVPVCAAGGEHSGCLVDIGSLLVAQKSCMWLPDLLSAGDGDTWLSPPGRNNLCWLVSIGLLCTFLHWLEQQERGSEHTASTAVRARETEFLVVLSFGIHKRQTCY